jgi:type I restriction enzyme S subunit
MKLQEGWKVMKLTDISENISAGGTPAREKKEYWQEGTIPWLKIGDMKSAYVKGTEEKITKAGLDNSSAKLFPKGTLVYSIFATLGAIGILEIDATTNQAIAGITPKKEIISTKYLYYCLQAERDKILAKKSHATQDNLNLTILRNHEIVVPPLPVQQEIVSILEKAEKAKEMRKEADELTKDFLKSVFMEMFYTEEFEKVELGKICEITSSKRIFQNEYVSNGIPFYRSKEVIELSKGEEISIELFISKKRYREIKENYDIPEGGDILLTAVGTIGVSYVLPDDREFYFKDGNLLWIRNLSGVDPIYLSCFLDYSFKNKKGSMTSGSAYQALTIITLNKLQIPLPPLPLQQKFASMVKEVEQIKEQQKHSKEQIDNLFNALMQKAFKGKLM